jgi:hypothetical protein
MGWKTYLVIVERYQPAKTKDEGDERKLKWYDVLNEYCRRGGDI